MSATNSQHTSNSSKIIQAIQYIKESMFLTFIIYLKILINSHLGYKGVLIRYYEPFDKLVREFCNETGYEVATYTEFDMEFGFDEFWIIKW